MKPRAFITGGGSKFGKHTVNCLIKNGYKVDNISSKKHPKANTAKVNWNELNYGIAKDALNQFKEGPVYDYIIFNANNHHHFWNKEYANSDETVHRRWKQSFFTNIELTNIVLTALKNRISKHTIVVTLLSGIVNREGIKSMGTLQDRYAGYTAMKTSAYFLMQGFHTHLEGSYICLDPGHMETEHDYKIKSNQFYQKLNVLKNKFKVYNFIPFGLFNLAEGEAVRTMAWKEIIYQR